MLPVTSLDGLLVGDGKVGPVFSRLLAAWSEDVGVDIAFQIQDWEGKKKPPSPSKPTTYRFK